MDPLFNISGKSIVVAGAGGGIGSAISQRLSERGARLTLCDIDRNNLASVEAQIGAHHVSAVGDIRSESDCHSVMRQACDSFNGVDVVINCAGVLPIEPADSMDAAIMYHALEHNVIGAFTLSKSAKRAMDAGGTIVHIASVSSLVANSGYSAYSSSKAALSQMVKVLAREWAEEGVRVNAIGPALIETPLTKDYLADSEFYANAIKSIPLGRLATTDDLLGAVILLSSPAGSFITGQTIYVDGGRTLV